LQVHNPTDKNYLAYNCINQNLHRTEAVRRLAKWICILRQQWICKQSC